LKNSNKPKFLLIGGFASSLINFRGPLLAELVKRFEVYAAAPLIDAITQAKVEALGVHCISTTFDRTGMNPIQDIKAVRNFKGQVKSIDPDVVLAYTIKPIVYALPATKSKKAKRFALITGKGSGFDMSSLKTRSIKTIVSKLYRNSLSSADGIVFQNSEDQSFFKKEKIVSQNSTIAVIEGTGVDMDHYKSFEKEDNDKIVFLFIARLIQEKGIPELIKATEILKAQGFDFEVQLLGWVDPNPGGISQAEIDQLHDSGLVNYLGTTDDVRPFMNQADVFVLPTYYNEGLPRTIQEAMSMKKPIITTDHPGCRETVVEGENGYLIPTRNSKALAGAMKKFLMNPLLIEKMGEKSYELCKEKFDVHKINAQLLKFMGIDDL
jgi:glycosyltransferase involved in cell wall biosynthesis